MKYAQMHGYIVAVIVFYSYGASNLFRAAVLFRAGSQSSERTLYVRIRRTGRHIYLASGYCTVFRHTYRYNADHGLCFFLRFFLSEL